MSIELNKLEEAIMLLEEVFDPKHTIITIESTNKAIDMLNELREDATSYTPSNKECQFMTVNGTGINFK